MSKIFSVFATGPVNGTSFADTMMIVKADGATVSSLAGDDNIKVVKAKTTLIDGGSGNDTIFVIQSDNATLIGGTDSDFMRAILGSAKMYGDAGDLSNPFPVFAFFDTSSMTTQTVVFSVPPTGFGNDTLFGTHGNDFMSGDSGKVATPVFFHTSSTVSDATQSLSFELTDSHFGFGDDKLYGGAGNDHICGDGDTSAGFMLGEGSTSGSTAIADGVNSSATAIFYTDHNSFDFGSDIIDGGDGNDNITGDVDVLGQDVALGIATATNGGTALSILGTADDLINYGNDQISGGNGNDIIFGEGLNDVHIATGGAATADSAGSVAKVLDLVGIDVHDHVTLSPLIDGFGDDNITGDAGNDTIYGDVKVYFNEATGGTATATNGGVAVSSYVVNVTIVSYGDDTVSGGSGDDNLVGDAFSTALEINAGVATGAGASVVVSFLNFKQIMGDDLLSGNAGNDLLVGDVVSYELLDEALSVSTVSAHIIVADQFNNTITFGNDLLSGGAGSDNFVTTVDLSTDNKLVAQGFDIISDFNKTTDSLTFIGTDLATLLSHTTVTHNGADSIINFDGGAGGSITLQHVNIASLNDIMVNVLPDASSLASHFPG